MDSAKCIVPSQSHSRLTADIGAVARAGTVARVPDDSGVEIGECDGDAAAVWSVVAAAHQVQLVGSNSVCLIRQ
jgi:hypothetical protein